MMIILLQDPYIFLIRYFYNSTTPAGQLETTYIMEECQKCMYMALCYTTPKGLLTKYKYVCGVCIRRMEKQQQKSKERIIIAKRK